MHSIEDWEELKDFWRMPRGRIAEPTHHAFQVNPTCGNEVGFDLIITEGMIREIKYHGSGTVLCLGVAAILVEWSKGKTIEEARTLNPLVHFQFDVPPARQECAQLAIRTFREALGATTQSA